MKFRSLINRILVFALVSSVVLFMKKEHGLQLIWQRSVRRHLSFFLLMQILQLNRNIS